jgi:hypothetical protein
LRHDISRPRCHVYALGMLALGRKQPICFVEESKLQQTLIRVPHGLDGW